eukprot:scaffold4451_cov60-Phaeocystis_antarctica.AAC.2
MACALVLAQSRQCHRRWSCGLQPTLAASFSKREWSRPVEKGKCRAGGAAARYTGRLGLTLQAALRTRHERLSRSGPNRKLRCGREARWKPPTPHHTRHGCLFVTPPGGSPASYSAGASAARTGASSMCARQARPVRLGASFEGVIRCCHHSRDRCTVICTLSALSELCGTMPLEEPNWEFSTFHTRVSQPRVVKYWGIWSVRRGAWRVGRRTWHVAGKDFEELRDVDRSILTSLYVETIQLRL